MKNEGSWVSLFTEKIDECIKCGNDKLPICKVCGKCYYCHSTLADLNHCKLQRIEIKEGIDGRA